MRGKVVAGVAALLVVATVGAAVVLRVHGIDPAEEPVAQKEPAQEAEEAPEVVDRAAEPDAAASAEPAAPDAEPATDAAAAAPAPAEPAFDTTAPVATETSASGISVTAPEGFLDTAAFQQVEAEVSALTGAGHHVGVVLCDLATGNGISFNADERLYPASSIKAPYSAMVCETYGGPGQLAPVMERCLVNSSNEDYEALISTYGMPAFGSWLRAHGAPVAADDGSVWYYPDISAGELAACWKEIYRFGTSGEAGSDVLAGYLARTNYTPIGALLRDRCEVWAKPGWFPDNGELVATNDAGVVFADSGPYVLVVMSDLSADLDGLRPLISDLDNAHEVMCTGMPVS